MLGVNFLINKKKMNIKLFKDYRYKKVLNNYASEKENC